MKPHQDHDLVLDKGKAVPHPKLPTNYTYRGANIGAASFERESFNEGRKKFSRFSIFTLIAATLGMGRAPKGGRR